MSVPAFLLLALLQRKTGEPADFLLLAMAAGWDGACCAEAAGIVSPGVSDWLIAPLLLLIAFMLFEQGYLSPLTRSGYVDRLAAERRLMRRTYARLLESRDALVLQDRLIAAGLLALGAAHEFKDVLTAVRLAAEHGRAGEGPEHKDRCLELVAEHADAGGASAAEFLERLGREGREEPACIEVRELIDHLVRIARPSWRAAGIILSVELGDGLAIIGRRREVEQVILNLLRNAVDAIELSPNCIHEIHIRAQQSDGAVEISVSDKAGGIPSHLAGSLFALGNTGTGSTGIGLYLARDLAMRNDGALTYSPIESGSCFVLSLPAIRV
jgi:signal transduction histidine kinase